MKKILLAAAIVFLPLFISCEKSGVPHTGDKTGALYGVWKLEKRTDIVPQSSGNQTTETDYVNNVNFFLALSNLGVPHALAKKGSFTALDLDDVDVDGTIFTFNADMNKISFKERLWLTELKELVLYSMELKGTYNVTELTKNKLVLQKETLGVTTIYTFSKFTPSE
jgi:hypothetical protein